MTAADPAPHLAALVERAIEARTLRLSFPPTLEARFDADALPARMRQLRRMGACGAIFYGLLFFCDMQLVPSSLVLAEEVRGTVTLLGLLAVAAVPRMATPQWVREALCGALNLLALCGLMLLFSASPPPDQAYYVNGTLLILLYGALALPTRFVAAATLTLLSAAIIAAGLILSSLSVGAKAAELTTTLALIVIALLTAWRLEKEQRRTYLLGLREILRNADLVASNANLRALAERDGLTGVLNRRAIDICLMERLGICREAGQPLGVIMLDVDHFKKFNDQYGHPAGDACLRRVAAVASAEIRREIDLIGRYGGEEFIVVLPDRDIAAAIRVAHRIRRAIERAAIPHAAAPSGLGLVTASLGVAATGAQWDESGSDTATALIQQADEQLYGAKKAGRNRVSPSFVLTAEEARIETV